MDTNIKDKNDVLQRIDAVCKTLDGGIAVSGKVDEYEAKLLLHPHPFASTISFTLLTISFHTKYEKLLNLPLLLMAE